MEEEEDGKQTEVQLFAFVGATPAIHPITSSSWLVALLVFSISIPLPGDSNVIPMSFLCLHASLDQTAICYSTFSYHKMKY